MADLDIKGKISEIVDSVTSKLKADPTLLANFKKEPVKTLETLTGKDLPDEQIEKIVNLVKAKLTADEAKDTLSSLKKIGTSLFGKK